GLHLDLTSPFAADTLGRKSLPALMALTWAGAADRESLRRSIERQILLFHTAMQAPPAFVDGHQHVHHLPIVRDTLLEALSERYGTEAAHIGVRACTARRWRGIKAEIVGRTGAAGLANLAASCGHMMNTDFAGVYDFAPDAPLAAHWTGWLSGLQ